MIVEPPDIGRALRHIYAAAEITERLREESGWGAGEPPNPAWWEYDGAAKSLGLAERELSRARTRTKGG